MGRECLNARSMIFAINVVMIHDGEMNDSTLS